MDASTSVGAFFVAGDREAFLHQAIFFFLGNLDFQSA